MVQHADIDHTGIPGVSGGGAALDYVKIEEQQVSGTNGGTFTSGAWQTRVLNTEVTDTAGIAALSANRVTLSAGTYEARIRCPAGAVDGHQVRLQNITAGTTLLLGGNEYSGNPASDFAFTTAFCSGVFTVAAAQQLEVQHRCGTTKATNGLGTPNSWGTEVYAVLEFWRRA
jgi:hypothetical protein